MKKEIRYLSGMKLVIHTKRKSTTVILYEGESSIVLCKVEGTDECFWVGHDFNENYLVIYSRGCMANQIPLTIEAVYDRTNKKIVNILKKNRIIFEYMCVAKKGIATAVVLEFLNDNKLEIAEKNEVEDFIRYITAENEEITKEEIKRYILKEYPILKDYMHFQSSITVNQYRKIISELDDVLRFHIMPNLLKNELLS